MDNSTTLWNIVIPAIAGFVGVAIGSLKPLIDWHIEKKKYRRQNRKDLFIRVMNTISSMDYNDWLFLQSVDYSIIKQFLPKDVVIRLEFGRQNDKEPTLEEVNSQRFGNTWLIDEVNKLGRKWQVF